MTDDELVMRSRFESGGWISDVVGFRVEVVMENGYYRGTVRLAGAAVFTERDPRPAGAYRGVEDYAGSLLRRYSVRLALSPLSVELLSPPEARGGHPPPSSDVADAEQLRGPREETGAELTSVALAEEELRVIRRSHLEDPNLDPAELKAAELVAALRRRGVPGELHWDRSPWGVRVPLTENDVELADYAQPSLFVLTEVERAVPELASVRWYGCLGGFGEERDSELSETTLEWVERSWLGETADDVAARVAALLPVLRERPTDARRREERRAALDQLTEEACELGLYDEESPADRAAALESARRRRSRSEE